MKRSMSGWLSVLCFFGLIAVCHSTSGLAVEIINKSDLQIATAILHVEGERKAPLYIKILQPKAEIDFTPEQAGPYLVSVKVFDTDQELRIEDVMETDRIEFENGKLTRISQ